MLHIRIKRTLPVQTLFKKDIQCEDLAETRCCAARWPACTFTRILPRHLKVQNPSRQSTCAAEIFQSCPNTHLFQHPNMQVCPTLKISKFGQRSQLKNHPKCNCADLSGMGSNRYGAWQFYCEVGSKATNPDFLTCRMEENLLFTTCILLKSMRSCS